MAKIYFTKDKLYALYNPSPLAPESPGLTAVDVDPDTSGVLVSYISSGHSELLTFENDTVMADGRAVAIQPPSQAYVDLQNVMEYGGQLKDGVPLDSLQTITLQRVALAVIQKVLGA